MLSTFAPKTQATYLILVKAEVTIDEQLLACLDYNWSRRLFGYRNPSHAFEKKKVKTTFFYPTNILLEAKSAKIAAFCHIFPVFSLKPDSCPFSLVPSFVRLLFAFLELGSWLLRTWLFVNGLSQFCHLLSCWPPACNWFRLNGGHDCCNVIWTRLTGALSVLIT